jgi:3-keto-disaccharide hydrolase
MSSYSRRSFLALSTAVLVGGSIAVRSAAEVASKENWVSLFDGKTLGRWKVTDFSGHGDVKAEGEKIVLDAGNDLTGVNLSGPVARIDYELALEAMLVAGSDFFCGLTFPYGEKSCTLVLGGWGGGTVGISSINGDDASENETTQFRKFEKGRWYKVRVRATAKKIEAWLDDDQIVDLDTTDKKIAMRAGEIELSEPLGIASFRTQAALRGIRIRPLSAQAAAVITSSTEKK